MAPGGESGQHGGGSGRCSDGDDDDGAYDDDLGLVVEEELRRQNDVLRAKLDAVRQRRKELHRILVGDSSRVEPEDEQLRSNITPTTSSNLVDAETRMMDEYNAALRRRSLSLEQFQSALSRKRIANMQLQLSSTWNVLSDCFYIDHRGPYATINGLRLGAYAPDVETGDVDRHHAGGSGTRDSSSSSSQQQNDNIPSRTARRATAMASNGGRGGGAGGVSSPSRRGVATASSGGAAASGAAMTAGGSVPTNDAADHSTPPASSSRRSYFHLFGPIHFAAASDSHQQQHGTTTGSSPGGGGGTDGSSAAAQRRVPWSEINSALGQLALLLSVLEREPHCGIRYRHRIVHQGSTSKIGIRRTGGGLLLGAVAPHAAATSPSFDLDDEDLSSLSLYNLYSDDSFQFFGRRNFNIALECLAECVIDAATAIQKRDRTITLPHEILEKNALPSSSNNTKTGTTATASNEVTIGGIPVTYGADGGTEWTTAMKYLLTDVKHLLTFRVFALWGY